MIVPFGSETVSMLLRSLATALALLVVSTVASAQNLEFSSDATLTGGVYGSVVVGRGGDATLVVTGPVASTGLLVVGDTHRGTLVLRGPGGSWQTNSATIRGNGTLAGSGIINGDVTFASGATFAVTTSGGASSLIVVNGRATLAGSVLHTAGSGALALNTRYTILRATNISGAFDSVTSNLAFLRPFLDHSSTQVDLIFERNGVPFTSVAQGETQTRLARALETLPPDDPLFQAFLSLDPVGAALALGALDPQSQSDLALGFGEAATLVRGLVFDRLHGYSLAAAAGDGQPAAAYASLMAGGPSALSRPAVWAEAFGAASRYSAHRGAPAMDIGRGGALAGIDGLVGDTWRVGVFGGLGWSRIDRSAGGSTGDSADFYAGLYANADRGPWRVTTAAVFSHHDVSTQRRPTFPAPQILTADYGVSSWQLAGELGYALNGAGLEWMPFVGLAHAETRSDAFTEVGGAAALSVAGERRASTTATLGLRLSRDLALGDWAGRVFASAGYSRTFDEGANLTTVRFATSAPFVVEGRDELEHVGRVGVGLDMSRGPTTVGLSLENEFGEAFLGGTGRLSFRHAF